MKVQCNWCSKSTELIPPKFFCKECKNKIDESVILTEIVKQVNMLIDTSFIGDVKGK